MADEGSDPFIFDRDPDRVLFAYHGQVAWEPEELFPNLLAMAAPLATVGSVVLSAGGA